MSAGITERDRQTGLEQAWHGETHIVEKVTKENSMPYEVIESPIYYKVPDEVLGIEQGESDYIVSPNMKQLIASDDFLPIGQPYGKSYQPTSIGTFWNVIEKGLQGIDYEVVSAGSVDSRGKIFASLKLHGGFNVGDREFKDYITVVDSFDKTTAFKVLYTNVCVVCANTYAMALNAGGEVGRAKHTVNVEDNIHRLIGSIKSFMNTSAVNHKKLQEAHQTPCENDEARSFLMGLETRTSTNITNGMVQKNARMMELFNHGKGNQGKTRLDAFSAYTEFHTHESSNRKGKGSQSYTSEWGSSARLKAVAFDALNNNWDNTVKSGEVVLANIA